MMKKNEMNNKGFASSMRILGLLAMVCLGCTAMAPSVAAVTYLDEHSVLANTTNFAVIDGTQYQYKHFFGICNQSGYGYTWSTGAYPYTDRKYLETLTVNGVTYPSVANTTDAFEWKMVNSLDQDAVVYKKGLAGYVDAADGDYYLWYGNVTAASSYYNGKSNWLFPTAENATYIVTLHVTWA